MCVLGVHSKGRATTSTLGPVTIVRETEGRVAWLILLEKGKRPESTLGKLWATAGRLDWNLNSRVFSAFEGHINFREE